MISDPPAEQLLARVSAEGRHAFAPGLVRIRLPNIHKCRIVSIEGDWTPPAPGSTPSRTMLCYGSSITHGACATPPEGTYVAQAAHRLGCDSINLGFGGAAQMDLAIAEHIASRSDWHFATFEMGINIRGWPLEKFRAAVDRFVTKIASAHPDKYLFCIDLFTNNCDFMANPTVGVGFREVVREIAEQQKSDKVIHVDGRTILTDPTGLYQDLIHPNDDGMREMGRNLADVVSRHMGGIPIQ